MTVHTLHSQPTNSFGWKYLTLPEDYEQRAYKYLQRAADYHRAGNDAFAKGCILKAEKKLRQAHEMRGLLTGEVFWRG